MVSFSEKVFLQLMHWYVSPQYEFSYADQDEPFGKKPYYNCCIGMVSPQNEFSYAGQDCPFVKKTFLQSWHWYGFSPV